MSVKSLASNNRGGEVLRSGLLKKLKTSRKKWFVLRAETPDSSARLEYYDSEKKFNSGQEPKRSIPLKTCFNINKRVDTKHKHVIALYTKDDCFCVVLESEEELDGWLKALLSLQHGEEAADGEAPRPTFEHVWHVAILNRGLGTDRIGKYRLCLTDKTLSLIKKDDHNSIINLNLSSIRSCGSLKHYFFLEVGRSSLLGAGELWIESEDTNIAQNIYTTVFHAMSTNSKHEEMRNRSASATESSKPNNSYRKQVVSGLPKATPYFTQTMGGTSCVGTTISHQRTQSLPLTDHPTTATTYAPPTTDYIPIHPSSRATINTTTPVNKRPNQSSKCRDRCESMPSRSRTISEGTHPIPGLRPYLTPHHSHGRDISHSPPSSSPISPPSVGCSTDSTGSSYSLTDETDMCMVNECPETMRYGPLTPDEAIAEEDCPESPCGMYESYVHMAPPSSDDGYVDMSPRSRLNTHSPSVSVSSIVSGTPSTDIRFSDYPLDKVSSYFVSEDDARPARAYSVGSRPEEYRGKRHIELAGTPEDPRVRSFSMGSKTKKGPSRVLQHHQHAGGKSVSAPILSNSRSHSSIDPMDNLMEMDFTKGSNNALNNNSAKTPSGYVEMKPGVEIIPRRQNPSPYMDMSARSAPYVDMGGGSPTSFVDISRHYRLPMNNNYVDMDHRKGKGKPSTSPAYPDYLDMSANQQSRRSERGSFSSHLSSSSSPKNSDYMPLSFFQQEQAKTPEGYVEMTLGKKHQRQSSLDSNQINSVNEDYLNMSVGPKKKPAKKEKAMSQPISIHPNTSAHAAKNSSSPISISSLLGRKSSTGTPPKMHLPLSTWSATPYSSLPRQRTRKDSRDSSSSSVTTPSSSSTIFPMSLNSPSSPMKPTKGETSSALKIPAAILNAIYKNNNKTNVSGDYAPMDFEVNKKGREATPMDFEVKKQGKENNPSEYVNYAPAARKPIVDDAMNDYAVMQPRAAEAARVSPLRTASGSIESGASPLLGHLSLIGVKESQSMCFRPIKEDSKGSPLGDDVAARLENPAVDKSPTAEVSAPRSSGECVSPAAKISRPNSVEGDKTPKVASTRPPDPAKSVASRPGSTSSELWSSSSTLVGSRPESVNSDRAPPDGKTDKLHYASLDLAHAQDDDESCSPRSSGGDSGAAPEATFLYAEIDFVKSDGLKQSPSQSLLSNAKVKH